VLNTTAFDIAYTPQVSAKKLKSLRKNCVERPSPKPKQS